MRNIFCVYLLLIYNLLRRYNDYDETYNENNQWNEQSYGDGAYKNTNTNMPTNETYPPKKPAENQENFRGLNQTHKFNEPNIAPRHALPRQPGPSSHGGNYGSRPSIPRPLGPPPRMHNDRYPRPNAPKHPPNDRSNFSPTNTHNFPPPNIPNFPPPGKVYNQTGYPENHGPRMPSGPEPDNRNIPPRHGHPQSINRRGGFNQGCPPMRHDSPRNESFQKHHESVPAGYNERPGFNQNTKLSQPPPQELPGLKKEPNPLFSHFQDNGAMHDTQKCK